MRPGALELSNVQGRVEVENVDFGYTPEKPILKALSVNAKPGQTIAIVGRPARGRRPSSTC